MVHGVVTLCFALVAAGSALLIWTMLNDHRVAILSALGISPVVDRRQMIVRRVRVRLVQPASVRVAQMRRAA